MTNYDAKHFFNKHGNRIIRHFWENYMNGDIKDFETYFHKDEYSKKLFLRNAEDQSEFHLEKGWITDEEHQSIKDMLYCSDIEAVILGIELIAAKQKEHNI